MVTLPSGALHHFELSQSCNEIGGGRANAILCRGKPSLVDWTDIRDTRQRRDIVIPPRTQNVLFVRTLAAT
jgi:hypothetical protein